VFYPNYIYDHANQNLFVPRMPSYLLKLLFALRRGRHWSVGVLQPLFGLGIEGQSGGWRWEGVLHHWRWNVYWVRRNWYTFAPSQFHFKIHYHFAWNDQNLPNYSLVPRGKQTKSLNRMIDFSGWPIQIFDGQCRNLKPLLSTIEMNGSKSGEE